MKLQVLQEDLTRGLNIAARFASPRSQLPILGNILFNVQKTKLTLCATNLETSVSIPIGASVKEMGNITIPARVITDIVANLPRGQINLEAAKENLVVSCEKYTSTISGTNDADFPSVPTALGKEKSSFPKELFTGALSQVIFAASSDETRPVLTGVLIIFQKNSLVFVATDGFRLSQKSVVATGVGDTDQVILPKNTLLELLRLANESSSIDIAFPKNESLALFGLGDIVLSSRIIQGEFPNFSKIIPQTTNIKIDLDKEELVRSVKLASVLARDSANAITFKIDKTGLVATSQSRQAGKQDIQIDARVEYLEGNDDVLEIAFNYKFIEDFLSSVKGDRVVVKLTSANAPGVFEDPQDKDYLHLIMPVKL
ncbi:DNA polymerase III subunit beta [Candidatus Woesebacteria bacterium]|nr:MAG: DNA polymerase III subunit beta [Candidatus Woesebacteria bacterium]